MHKIEELLDVMSRLRDRERGCPWDLKQTYATIVPYTIEEAYEVADAIERNDFDELKSELGDLLFQVVFYAQIAKEERRFEFTDVVDAIVEKMLRRHPHVFGDAEAKDEQSIKQNWEAIKQAERNASGRAEDRSVLQGIPVTLPAITRAKKLQHRAHQVGFDWPDHVGAIEKLDEEVEEFKSAVHSGDVSHVEEELGDLMFVCVNIARLLKIDAESALRKSNQKFERRFREMESIAEAAGRTLHEYDTDGLDKLWNDAKNAMKPAK